MSNNYAVTAIVGRLVRDPELRYLPSGTAVVNFSIPVTRRWGSEENQQLTNWYNCQIFGKRAEFFLKYASKGTMIAGSGDLDLNTWESDSGPKSSLRITLNNFEFLDKWGKKEETQEEASSDVLFDEGFTEDEIPF